MRIEKLSPKAKAMRQANMVSVGIEICSIKIYRCRDKAMPCLYDQTFYFNNNKFSYTNALHTYSYVTCTGI